MNGYIVIHKKKSDTRTIIHYIYTTHQKYKNILKKYTQKLKYNTFNTLLKKLPDTVQFKKLSRIYLIFFLLFIFLSYLSSYGIYVYTINTPFLSLSLSTFSTLYSLFFTLLTQIISFLIFIPSVYLYYFYLPAGTAKSLRRLFNSIFSSPILVNCCCKFNMSLFNLPFSNLVF